MQIRNIDLSFKLCERYQLELVSNFQKVLNFLNNYTQIYDIEKDKLPYHINLIDELRVDENAHSRIFAKILNYKIKDKYPFLVKFLNDVCKFNLKIEEPKIKKVDSCGRIDIPIFDNKYVVIIENKVTDKALDQNGHRGGQLARYIENIKDNYNIILEEIYIIYLPKYTREPSDECWINKHDISYKDDFKFRFRSLSYKDCIYPWLKNITIDKSNIYLNSAIEQYVDYLEGIFSLRIIDNNMNMELHNFIKSELHLSDDNPEDAIKILSDKEIIMNHTISQIQQLKTDYQKQIIINKFNNWKLMLENEFPNYTIVGDTFNIDKNCINIGVILSFENNNYAIMVECNDCTKPNIYVGIGRHFVDDFKYNVPDTLHDILNKHHLYKSDDYWYGWKYTTLENGYTLLKNIIKM